MDHYIHKAFQGFLHKLKIYPNPFITDITASPSGLHISDTPFIRRSANQFFTVSSDTFW